jgi:hypothetical protein
MLQSDARNDSYQDELSPKPELSRGALRRVAIEINFAAWGMIACAAIKLTRWLF